MDRITQSLLAEFSKEHDIASLKEDVRFEHFAAYITVRRYYSETFDSEDIVVGAGADTGIDAVGIIVNGSLVTDIETFETQADKTGSLDVTFVFVQAERSSSFEAAKIGNFAFGVMDFFKDNPVIPRNKAVKDAAEIMSAVYHRAQKFKHGNPACRLFYVTTGRWQGDANLETRRSQTETDLKATNLFREVEFQCVGADGIQKLYSLTKNAICREFTFTNRTVVPEIDGVSEAYLGFIPAPAFLKIVTDDDGDIIKSIFYDNVRDWQDYNPVNGEIRATLGSDHKDRFVLMNNGVTIIARTLRPTGNRFYIEDFQIVNGCQTSHVLADAADKLDDSVMIPLRLIGTQDEEVIESIIHATNRQTEVKREQFLAATDVAKKMEIFFGSFPNGQKLYYERRSHQYDNLPIERTRIVTPTNLIRAFAAMFLAEPHATTRSYSALADKVGTDIFSDNHRLEPYYVAAFTLYKLEYLFRNQRLAPEYKPARFHILLAARLLANDAALPKMNANEMEKYCKIITDTLWDSSKADNLIERAAVAVEVVAQGNFDRDNIRTQPFTDKVIAYCAKKK